MENIGEAWHAETAKRIGATVARCRKDAEMTAQQLAERCGALGAPIHRTTITKIENGRPRFDLGELLILAAALGVPPIVLLYPDIPDGEIEVLPGWTAGSWTAVNWATGTKVTNHSTSPDTWPETRGARLIDSVRKWIDAKRMLALKNSQLAGSGDNEELRKALAEEVAEWTGVVRQRNGEIQELGGVLDDAPAAVETR
jgi:transcriptional regulator with XRE-family HTH domain